MIRVAIHGATGRMGQRLCALAHDDERFDCVATLGRETSITCDAIDVVIDFSQPDGVRRAVGIARDYGAALLCGTTGLSSEILRELGDSARSIPVMIAPNTSLGVAVLRHVVCEAARLLGPRFDLDLIETHHVGKRDAPSGTALRIADDLRDRAARAVTPDRIHAVRAGDVIGEHEIVFSGPGERLRLTHAATTRDLFARGALEAAAWLSGRAPGSYTIESALGL